MARGKISTYVNMIYRRIVPVKSTGGVFLEQKHNFFYKLLLPVVKVFVKVKFGYKWEKAKNLPENYIVLSNHVTDYDPLLVGVSFPKQMYFVASEHITRWGFAYNLLKYIMHPIIRYKGTVATATVIEILRKVRAGGSVAVFAEGVRTNHQTAVFD